MRKWLLWVVFAASMLSLVACSASAPADDVSDAGDDPVASVAAGTGSTGSAADDGGVTYVCADGESFEECDGTKVVVGGAGSANFAFTESLYPNPSAVLVSVDNWLSGEPERFVDKSDQILGRLSAPLFPGPGRLRVGLPFEPTARSVDLDNDDTDDAGVQVFALVTASNLFGDSYLEQLEQEDGLGSYLIDPVTGDITEGSFLVWAPDAEQGFPSGFGADGIWFSADDPTVVIPSGYTVATLGADGRVTLDRSSEAEMNSRELAEAASPDFSDQSMLDGYHSMIDALAERYAYTELRGLDWEAIRAEFLPRIEAADAASDELAFYAAVKDLALHIGDAHFGASASGNAEATLDEARKLAEAYGANIGAEAILASAGDDADADGASRLLVLSVGDGSPAADAGWVPGTEIVTVGGMPAADHIASVPLFRAAGTDETRRLQQLGLALKFPADETVSIGYRLPGATAVVTREMQTGMYDTGLVSSTATYSEPVSYEQRGDVAIVRWSDFMGYVLPKLAVLEEALATEKERGSAGIILDLRGNTGGWVTLYETMASYFFTEDKPMPLHVFDWWSYNDEAGEHVRTFARDAMLSAPNPGFAYTGPLVVLIDEHCASACEYLTQHLQVLDRATVIGQHGSRGAGGFVDRIRLPGGVDLTYTVGQTTFAGTEEPNLEAKGVVPDILVPVTLETEQAKARGEDPVMEAALAHLAEVAAESAVAELPGTTWRFKSLVEAGAAVETAVDTPDAYTVRFGEEGAVEIRADCNTLSGTYSLEDETGTLTIVPEDVALDSCAEGSISGNFVRWLAASRAFDLDGSQLTILPSPESGARALAFEPAE